ncbi:MFS transporter, partial [Porticoccaceae bacterium]|nr:MFS transporter [Porticoccaceae bacterium]
KEASIPGILGIATLLSLKTSQPLIHTLLLNESVFDVKRINQGLTDNQSHSQFNQLLINASWILAGSFFLSSILNYLLAVIILTADPGTVSFNEQLGKMTALSFPVIALPAMAVMMGNLFYLFRGIKRLTGLDLEFIVKQK